MRAARAQHARATSLQIAVMDGAMALAEEIKAAATEHIPFSGEELDRAVASLQQVAEAAGVTSVDWPAYRELLVRSPRTVRSWLHHR